MYRFLLLLFMKYIYIKVLAILSVVMSALNIQTVAASERDRLVAIGFYNMENLFDTLHDENKDDHEFLPDGKYQWTEVKYRHKLANMARVIGEMASGKTEGVGCAIVGLAEVENARVLDDLCRQEPLAKKGYRYCHVEGPDNRGIDCALLYNPKKFRVRNVKLVPYVQVLEKDSAFHTRGFLTVSGTLRGEHLTVVVCHLPSRGAKPFYRCLGARQVKALCDSLKNDDPNVDIVVMGDMNDDPEDKSMAEELRGRREQSEVGEDGMFNPWWNIHAAGQWTLTYREEKNLFDQILLSPSLLASGGGLSYSDCEIFRRDYLIRAAGKYKGTTMRTHSGGAWLDGYSDHLPTIVYLRQQ